MRLVIVDFEMGNLPSVQKAFRAVGREAAITADPAEIERADAVVLPGVGAFGAGMRNLRRLGLVEPLRRYAASGRPFAGICVGMQLLFEAGEEFGEHEGLGILPGRVTLLPGNVKLPHIGWNQSVTRGAHPVLRGLPSPFWAYFVHSFAAEQVPEDDVAAVTEYGRPFPSVVARGNVVGAQFHPEKSAAAGLQLLKNFAETAAVRA
jgi:imidazole glycerol-phosphate synthase subunit HisH